MSATARSDPAAVTSRARLSWALYDWANSSFFAVVATFVFPAYLAQAVAADVNHGTELWGYTVGLAGLAIAIAAPLLGALADRSGRRKPWIAGFTAIAVLATAALWWVTPGPEALLLGLVAAGLATVAAELAIVFYNAMLPDLTSPERVGRWSGWAWGLGYLGGIGCLVIALFGFVGEAPWFALPREEATHIRATFLLVALWFGAFALPLLLLTPDAGAARGAAAGSGTPGAGWGWVGRLRELARYPGILRFLLARMLFIDGLATLFAFGGVYAAGSFGFSTEQVLLFGIGLNITAGLGALAFAWVDDRIGSKATILISLVGLIIPGAVLLVAQSASAFWLLGLLLGVFVGPVQSAGRSYLARSAPAHLRAEMFGLFAFSGKATAFAGPLLVGWVTGVFDSQRAGMSVIIVLLVIGWVLMWWVPPAGPEAGRRSGEGAAVPDKG